MLIIPSIYPESFEEVADKLYILDGISNFAQIVFCDGSYGLRQSWAPHGREILPSTFSYEFDCILTDWREYIMKVYRLGAKSVVIHVDEFSDTDYDDLFKIVGMYGLRLGVTVSNDVSIDVIIHAMEKIKLSTLFTNPFNAFIQVPGMKNTLDASRPFDERVLHRIRVLKQMFPSYSIQVSGRVTPDTIAYIKEAGADRVVVSTYIFGHEDIREALYLLMKAADTPIVKETPALVEKIEEPKEVVIVPEPVVTKNEGDPDYKASADEIVYNFDEDPFGKRI